MKLTNHNLSLLASLALASSAAAYQAPSEQVFRAVAAPRLAATPANLVVDRIEGPVQLADLGAELYVAAVSTVGGDKTVVALDARGSSVDLAAAIAADREIGRARRGKLSARLAQRFAAIGADERNLCAVWIAVPDVEDLRADHAHLTRALEAGGLLSRELAEHHERELARAVSERVRPAGRLAAERLADLGLEVVPASDDVPLVFVRGSARELAALHAEPLVLSIDDASQEYGERLATAVQEVRADQVWFAAGGTLGAGATVAVVEPGMICVDNPQLPVPIVRPNGTASAHTTGVASCIGGRDPWARGVAPNATLISACAADFTTGSSNVTTQMPGSVGAVSWAVSLGAQILNLSYGATNPTSTLSSFDRYLDWVARNQGRTIVVACGNSGSFAGDPGAGFNQIAVGAFSEGASTSWGTEAIANFSSWRNPTTGLETPQMAAPGVGMNMYACSPASSTGYFDSGTSFSAPMVAGAAALCVSKAPVLGSWPEAVRAILMAGAWHNIEGATSLSSKDGAGGLDAKAAWRIANRGTNGGFGFGSLSASSFDANGFLQAQTGYATRGQTVRVALSFDSTVSNGGSYASDTLMADLDLYVYDSTGALVASSLSAVQPFEVVQFSAPRTGTYTVKIKRHSFSGTTEFYGTAFTTNSDQ